jgi:hypothetical protein
MSDTTTGLNPDDLVAVALLADSLAVSVVELGVELAALGVAPVVDDLNIKFVTRRDGHRLLEARRQREQAQAAAAATAQAERDRDFDTQQRRLAAIAAKAESIRATDRDMSPFAQLRAGDRDERADASAERMDEFLNIGHNAYGTMHRLTPSKET